MKLPVTMFLSMLLAGCGTDWAKNEYEAIRKHPVHVVPDPAAMRPMPDTTDSQPSALPDYEHYKRERDKLKGEPTL